MQRCTFTLNLRLSLQLSSMFFISSVFHHLNDTAEEHGKDKNWRLKFKSSDVCGYTKEPHHTTKSDLFFIDLSIIDSLCLRYSERIRTESRVDNSLTTWFQLFTTELARRTHLPTHGDSFMTGSKFRGLKSPELRHGDTKERRFCQAWLRKAPKSPNTWKRARHENVQLPRMYGGGTLSCRNKTKYSQIVCGMRPCWTSLSSGKEEQLKTESRQPRLRKPQGHTN